MVKRKNGGIDEAVKDCQRKYCTAVIGLYGGNVTKAAKHAGRDRPTFYRLLWRLGIRQKLC